MPHKCENLNLIPSTHLKSWVYGVCSPGGEVETNEFLGLANLVTSSLAYIRDAVKNKNKRQQGATPEEEYKRLVILQLFLFWAVFDACVIIILKVSQSSFMASI